jgi:benzylsuccinate CoA-transferase BbsF subunit
MSEILAGLRVLDFCWIGAGALVTQTLALHGAEVIKIESRARPDNLRVAPPVRPGTSGLDASGYFASRNAGKKSFALNMSHPSAVSVARRLARASSVVTSNFRPGVMERWGLSYPELSAGQPDLIYLTMPMQGATGPHARYAGFGSTIAALSGLVAPSGLPGRVPVGTGTHYPDHVPNPGHALVALLAALVHRNRTGRGGRIELSQFESTTGLLGPAVIRYSATGEQPAARGNRVPWAAPHGVYPCQGDDTWIAVSASTEAQWAALSGVLAAGPPAPADAPGAAGLPEPEAGGHPEPGPAGHPEPDLAADPRFAGLDLRREHEDALDGQVASRTARWDRWELMGRLQAAGVPASVVETTADVFDDPVLAARGYWRVLEHPVMGPVRNASAPHLWDGQPVSPQSPAPLLGQHTQEIAGDLLGLSDGEYRQLVEGGVLW